MKSNREPWSGFLPRFRALVELGNWSEDLEKSIGLIRATKKVYERIHKDQSDPLYDRLQELHEKWLLQLSLQVLPGQVRVYRVTTQYLKPATYRLTVSCDDDCDNDGTQYFSKTTDVYDNSQNLEDIARTLIRKATTMF